MKSILTLAFLFLTLPANAQVEIFTPEDVFDLEWVSDPQIAPDGRSIAYLRNSFDKMLDRSRSEIWLSNRDGSVNRRLEFEGPSSQAQWSAKGDRLMFTSSESGSKQIYLAWPDEDRTQKISSLSSSPSSMRWSPDGKWIAFRMFVESKPGSNIKMPKKPEGAEWADPPRMIRDLKFQSDGSGFNKQGASHVFVISSDGGAEQQVTHGDQGFSGSLEWSNDGKSIFASANHREDRELNSNDSDIYRITVFGKAVNKITSRNGPDLSPVLSPDGRKLAILGYVDKLMGFQASQISVLDLESEKIISTTRFEDSASQIKWGSDSNSIYYAFDKDGNGKIGHLDNGESQLLAENRGGTTMGRPYGSGSFSVANDGTIAYTYGTSDRPAELAVLNPGSSDAQILTSLNDDLFAFTKLGTVEELWYKSSHDQIDIQSWIAYPPNFDASKKYPLLLEIHGGPFANYGDRFSSEVQMYASAGYVVLYVNPRGSTSYGADFANLIHHNYPNEDYDDLMSGVDAVIAKGFIDSDQLYVTGGSGGGVLSSWIVGKTDRFRAAVVAKPVINWFSFVLTADNPQTYYKYWFPAAPWEDPEHYYKRSPISLVGNVKTPTMLLTGEEDRRTPMSETEQYYSALKIRQVPTALVRIPGVGHGIAGRPSQMIAKVLHVLAWFEEHQD